MKHAQPPQGDLRQDLVDARLRRCARRWSLQDLRELSGGYSSRVFAARDASGAALVVKLARGHLDALEEAAALRCWAGDGAVELIDFDQDEAALLLPRIEPGYPLSEDAAMDADPHVAALLKRLHATQPDDDTFPSLSVAVDRYFERVRLDAESGASGVPLLVTARGAAARLCATATEAVLLHGDVLAKNLLRRADGYVAIDPMPRIGDPCADIGFFAAGEPPASNMVDRARRLAEMVGCRPDRAERWAAV